MGYSEGFEDGLEFCLYEFQKKENAEKKVREVIEEVKKRKFERLKILLKSR